MAAAFVLKIVSGSEKQFFVFPSEETELEKLLTHRRK
jgi:hypothetical protein